ncbi:MAG TPA: alpha-galactosidase [Clostridiales bacterium]|nr:alpha-galactosidase [Clostridiales bacterium]
MRKKIAFIGAGSLGFTRGLVRDILTFPALANAEISLMDIDTERLNYAKKAVERIIEAGNYPVIVTATTDRIEAIRNADGVVCTILQGGVDIWRYDIEIPKKYGVDINVGDTRGPSGIFRFLRTAPVMVSIIEDISRYAPNAIFLNYTNPMAMLCRIMQEVQPDVKTSGLCHSVQGTAAMLARWIGAPMEEITYHCAGINHQAFFLEFKWNGKDAYPLIRKAITENEDIYNEEQVRNEMFLALDYYVTESSGHNSEYNAWFRKRPDLIEKYCTHGTGWNPGEYAYILKEYEKGEKTWRDNFIKFLEEPVNLERGHEYAAYIFNACFGDGTMYKFNGNVRNFNLIDNLPYGCCVEVPVLASRKGLEPIHSQPLPLQIAPLVNTSALCEELAVKGCLEGNPRLIYQAICHDPLTAAVLSLREIQSMTDELFEKNKDYLPQFKHLK